MSSQNLEKSSSVEKVIHDLLLFDKEELLNGDEPFNMMVNKDQPK